MASTPASNNITGRENQRPLWRIKTTKFEFELSAGGKSVRDRIYSQTGLVKKVKHIKINQE